MLIPQQRECKAWKYPRRNSSESVKIVGIDHSGSQTYSLSKNEGHVADQRRDADALVENLLQQETLMDQAKNARTLVKRFIGFLRVAYPMEMREFSAAIQPRKRRSWRNARVAFLSKNRGTGCKVTPTTTKCTTQETTKAICTCKTPCDNAVIDTEEPDKYKLFFSNPPLCRPTTTIHPLDMLPTTDMCGHSCDCHTEATVTDNDKEIFVGVPKTSPLFNHPVTE